MHIPDGYLDLTICVVTWGIMLAYWVLAYRKLEKMKPESVTYISSLAAVIFVAQMLNWPLSGGTSLHFVGGALAGILLGPYIGFVVMFIVLFVQCIVFHDGGITTLGANVLNMGIIDVLVGYYIYRFFVKKQDDKKFRALGAFLGGWFGITLAGIAAGIELGLSSKFVFGLEVTLYVMGFYHFVLGIIEGIITGLAIYYLSNRGVNIPLIEEV